MTHKISWLNIPGYKGQTWNPIVGCTKISEGCRNCYAERMANRLKSNPKVAEKYSGTIIDGYWSGNLNFDSEVIYEAFTWRTPRAVFVCSMSDLFNQNSKTEWIDKVMITAALLPMHKFIILTKRPELMASYFSIGKEKLLDRWSNVLLESMAVADNDNEPDGLIAYMYNRAEGCVKPEHNGWPFNNIWLGVTAENQQHANERIPILLRIPATIHFVSIEPMLGPVMLRNSDYDGSYDFLSGDVFCAGMNEPCQSTKLDWVIVGGETGSKARLMKTEWADSIKNQCNNAKVPFFFKSWGNRNQLPGNTYIVWQYNDCKQFPIK